MKLLIFIALVLTMNVVHAKGKKTKIKYEKRQKIDLGALVIEGKIVSPGDFNVEDEKEKATKLLYKRKNYNDRLRINIEYVF